MKRLIAGLAGMLSLFATQAVAQSITYYVTSAPYDNVSNYTSCPAVLMPPSGPGCTTTYTTSQRLSGSFTILGLLGPNLVDHVVDVRVGDLNISDGQNSFLQADFDSWNVVAQTAQVSTDASGNLTFFEFKFDKMHGLIPTANTPGNARSYVTSIYFGRTAGNSFAYVQTNSLCTVRGDNVGGNTAPPANGPFGCATQVSNAAQGASVASASSVTLSLTPPPPLPPAPVPTLSEWAMILFGVLLAGLAAMSLQRRRQRV